jgi:hypothetical protein
MAASCFARVAAAKMAISGSHDLRRLVSNAGRHNALRAPGLRPRAKNKAGNNAAFPQRFASEVTLLAMTGPRSTH